ncbi:MAG: hypothetical protein AAF511_09660 [Pseudomonadota bacterium]
MQTFVKAIAAALPLVATPAFAGAGYDCDAHATHIDKEIGAQKALAAYAILHDHKADPDHLIDDLKAEHPTVEKELEDYAEHNCGRELLVAHANDH